MADKITSTNNLVIGMEFVDGDDRLLKLDNPRTNVTATEINAVATMAKTGNLILGDKAKADFLGFKSAKVVQNVHTKFDLSVD